jgi:hypothetical protein
MAFGLLGHCKPASATTETLIYTAPLNKKAVGSVTIMNSAASGDQRASMVMVTASVSVTSPLTGLYTTAKAGTDSDKALALYNALLKATSTDDGIPVVISGVVLGPGQSLIAYNESGTDLHYVFNGIEEGV